MIVYKIQNNLNNKAYVGITKNSIEDRLKQHYKNKKCSIISLALRKYGKENFTVEVLENCKTLDEANILEIFYIIKHNTVSPNGYNLHTGGNSHEISEETKIKQSKAQKLRFKNPIELEKMRKRLEGKNLTQDTKTKISK